MKKDLNYWVNHLGHQVQDRVTGIQGVVTSVSFDLYGCVQGLINRGVDQNGQIMDQVWLDMARLTVTSERPVMQQPDFNSGPVAEGLKGPSAKPSTKGMA